MKWICLALIMITCACSKQEAKPKLFHVDPATAGVISGSVRFRGQPEKTVVIDMDQDPDCSKLYKDGRRPAELVVVGQSGELANAFVYVKSGLEGKTFASLPAAARIDQKGCWFQPRVTGIETGQSLLVTNSDPVTHNIHPQARVNREWNQSQAPEDQPINRRFAQPEIMIPVKCNVHKWMRAWIGVVGHPYFAVTGADGKFEMKNLPPGSYTLVAWHEKLGTREQMIQLGASASPKLDFLFDGQ